MANEQLIQQGYFTASGLKGEKEGRYEIFRLGDTTVSELRGCGFPIDSTKTIRFPFVRFSPPSSLLRLKPDKLYCLRNDEQLRVVGVSESKAPRKFKSAVDQQYAHEQSLCAAVVFGAKVAVATDGTRFHYIDVETSLSTGTIVLRSESRQLNPGVLDELISAAPGQMKDPTVLAEKVWQSIWHATKAEPKECLLTFVEIFVLKFLSDNLPENLLPRSQSFYELTIDPSDFRRRHGTTAIEYYTKHIRQTIKTIFPEKTLASDTTLGAIFGLQTIVSQASVIDGFAFLRSSEQSIATFNRTFLEILDAFEEYGPLTNIDPEFKLRLYETFLKRSSRQQKLGQFFTPRNVVKSMVRMAQLDKLQDNAIVLDPAAGVGGFVLEPLIIPGSLEGNIKLRDSGYTRRVRTIGVDVDKNLHILGKANMLLHLAEQVRDTSVTMEAVNAVMADTFLLFNTNETLGSLEHPPRGVIDVILTNPPYVTQGSAIYRKELAEVDGLRNGLTLNDYYGGCGLGVEALFLRYIAGALKPGGRAFVIVPLGMLNRTEPKPKSYLLEQCNIVGSIQLPPNTFFNTSQKTYILVLEKRRTARASRPRVFCAIASSIGETLDWKRIPEPDRNDLDSIAALFLAHANGREVIDTRVRVVDAGEFSPTHRWDVTRFWQRDELIALGEREPVMSREGFIDEASVQLKTHVLSLKRSQRKLARLREIGDALKICLGDTDLFALRSGTRITDRVIRDNPGDVPVYSCFRSAEIEKGRISRKWLDENHVPIESGRIVTVNANGASVGRVFYRDNECVITDDVIIVQPLRPDIDVIYLAMKLKEAVAAGGFLYEAKLFLTRVAELSIDVPCLPDGRLDLPRQRKLGVVLKEFDDAKASLAAFTSWIETVNIE